MGNPVRYSMPVPEHTRIIWTSAEARKIWEPRIARIVQAWETIERASVDHFRMACRQSVSPEALPLLSMKVAEAGRALLVLGQNGVTPQYQARPVAVRQGQPFTYSVVIARDMVAARAFAIAIDQNDNGVIGDLLGYPPCCIRFFERIWVQERWIDTTWPMVMADGQNKVVREVQPYNNILLRWLGVRLVPHLPCSFDCPATRALAKSFAVLMEAGFEDEHRWMMDLLSANIEWNAMKGTAEIRTPILKIATSTDALSEPVSVRLNGTVTLDGAARGNMFPWQETNARPTIAPMVFHKTTPEKAPSDQSEPRRAIISAVPASLPAEKENASPSLSVIPEAPWQQNGFTSLEAMEAAHNSIMDFYRGGGFGSHDRLVDLGCGNGMLAMKLSDRAIGVEVDEERCRSARRRLRAAAHSTIIDWMRQEIGSFDVALLMPGRLSEMEPDDRAFALRWLRNHVKRVIVYNYDGRLAELCKELRITIKWRAVFSTTSVAEMVMPPVVALK